MAELPPPPLNKPRLKSGNVLDIGMYAYIHQSRPIHATIE